MALSVRAPIAVLLALAGCYDSASKPAVMPSPHARPRLPAGASDHAPVELSGELENALAGFSVELARDATGDGVADLLVGAPGSHADSGRVYLLAGPFDADRTLAAAELVLQGEPEAGRAGETLATADVDADRISDLLIGATRSGAGAGAAYLVRGPQLGVLALAAADARFTGARPGDNLGQALALVPDGGDASVLIGVPHTAPEYAGAAFAWPGSVSGDAQPDSAAASFQSARAGAHAGTSLASGCDADGDGAHDLLVGAWGDDAGVSGGAAYLVLGPLEGARPLEDADAIYVSTTPGAAAGTTVLLADLDASGRCDVLIGAPGERDGGVVYGFLDRSEGRFELDDADFRVAAAHPGDGVGLAMAAGDQDADGYLDLWVGAPGSDEAGDGSGAVYLVYGPPAGAIVLNQAQPRLLGRAQGDHFGAALASGGDLDGDGSHDLAIGAWGRGTDNRGAVFVFRNAEDSSHLRSED